MKVLIIRFSSIGDIVLTTPVVRCLKRQLQAEVHYVCKAAYGGILRPNPYIDKVWTLGDNWTEMVRALKGERFDVVIDLHKNLRSWRLRWAIGGRAYAFDKLNVAKWLLVNWKYDCLPSVHIVDRYLGAVKRLGVANEEEGLDFFIAPEDVVDVGATFGEAYASEQGYVAVVVGAAHATKRLPVDKVAAICGQVGVPCILLGGPQDKAFGEQVAQGVAGVCANACGRLRLGESASVIRQARKVVSPDTGLMHIAAALGKDIVSVWGNTVPKFGMYPYFGKGQAGSWTAVEVAGLGCRPCSKIGFDKCPKGHFRCMADIRPEEVIKHLGEL